MEQGKAKGFEVKEGKARRGAETQTVPQIVGDLRRGKDHRGYGGVLECFELDCPLKQEFDAGFIFVREALGFYCSSTLQLS
jgi:hypothetical protein